MKGEANSSRSIEILLQFASAQVLTAAQISTRTGIPASAVYRHLAVLLQSGLVATANNRGQFSAGPETLRLAAHFRQESIVRSHVSSTLQQLCDETQELAAYLVVSGMQALCVDAVEGPQMLRCSYSPGRSQPLYRGASAMALLAHLSPERRSGIISALALDTAGEDALRQELQIVAHRGFALSNGAVDAGVWGVSFPVFDSSGQLAGAVSSMAPSARAIRNEKRLIALTHSTAVLLNQADKGI